MSPQSGDLTPSLTRLPAVPEGNPGVRRRSSPRNTAGGPSGGRGGLGGGGGGGFLLFSRHLDMFDAVREGEELSLDLDGGLPHIRDSTAVPLIADSQEPPEVLSSEGRYRGRVVGSRLCGLPGLEFNPEQSEITKQQLEARSPTESDG